MRITRRASADRTVHRRTLPSGRAVVGGLLMAVAAFGTFAAQSSSSGDGRVGVLIAARQLDPGTLIQPGDVALARVTLDDSVRGLFGSVEAVLGRTTIASVGPGEFVLASAVAEEAPVSGLEMELHLGVDRVSSAIGPGDTVDVFATWGGETTELIATGALVAVVSGADGSDPLVGEQRVVRLTVSTFGELEALVHAQVTGELTLVRSTGRSDDGHLGDGFRPESDAGTTTSDPEVAP